VKDRIQSWASLLLGAAVVVLLGMLTYDQMSRTPRARAAELDAGAEASSASAISGEAGAPATTTDGGAIGPLDTSVDGGLSLLSTMLGDSGAMPSGAPRSVRVGVVLVQFAGAEGASSSARAKPDALKHARELAEQGRADWKATVNEGDSGSAEDIGRIPRGVLEQPTEVAVFSLATGDVSEPLETPRGYWVVKRLE
jgi:hypothetical protein